MLDLMKLDLSKMKEGFEIASRIRAQRDDVAREIKTITAASLYETSPAGIFLLLQLAHLSERVANFPRSIHVDAGYSGHGDDLPDVMVTPYLGDDQIWRISVRDERALSCVNKPIVRETLAEAILNAAGLPCSVSYREIFTPYLDALDREIIGRLGGLLARLPKHSATSAMAVGPALARLFKLQRHEIPTFAAAFYYHCADRGADLETIASPELESRASRIASLRSTEGFGDSLPEMPLTYCRGPVTVLLARNYLAHEDVDCFIRAALAAGASPNVADGGVPLTHLIARRFDLDMIRTMSTSGADMTARDPSGGTLLHTAVARDNVAGLLDIVRYLVLECGVEPHAKNDDGITASDGITDRTLSMSGRRESSTYKTLEDYGAVQRFLEERTSPSDPDKNTPEKENDDA